MHILTKFSVFSYQNGLAKAAPYWKKRPKYFSKILWHYHLNNPKDLKIGDFGNASLRIQKGAHTDFVVLSEVLDFLSFSLVPNVARHGTQIDKTLSKNVKMLKNQKMLESKKNCNFGKLQEIPQRARKMHTLEDAGMLEHVTC